MATKKQIDLLVEKFGTFEIKLDTLDKKVDKLQITSEASHDLVKIGLDGLEGLRESTAASFEEMSKEHAEQTDLLKSAVIHVRQRVERVERRKPRRRRS